MSRLSANIATLSDTRGVSSFGRTWMRHSMRHSRSTQRSGDLLLWMHMDETLYPAPRGSLLFLSPFLTGLLPLLTFVLPSLLSVSLPHFSFSVPQFSFLLPSPLFFPRPFLHTLQYTLRPSNATHLAAILVDDPAPKVDCLHI